MTITRDGLREILISTATLGAGGLVAAWAAVAASPWYWVASAGLLVLWLFVLAFFRDPHRTVPQGRGLLVAPADGKVTDVTRLDHCEGFEGGALRIGIFLSVFDVHINRSPCAGRVLNIDYRPGEFLDARHPECGARNEANKITIQPAHGNAGPVVVRQIAGLIARRIVCNVVSGDALERGQRIGMIKFGSRTELIVPADSGFEPAVRAGDRVKGGSTILMRPAGEAPGSKSSETHDRPAARAAPAPVACDSGSSVQ